MLLKIPYFLYKRNRLMKASDAYWEKKMKGKCLELDGRTIKPRAQALMNLQEMFAVPVEKWTPKKVRFGYRKSVELFDGPKLPVNEVRDFSVDLEGRTLGARLYKHQTANENSPAIVYFHGGGFVIGDLDTHDGVCRRLARESGYAVIAIDYRLGPESPYPAAMQDAVDSWVWLQQNADSLGIDETKISAAGDSAGAALAIVVGSVASKGEIGHKPTALGLIYPPSMTVDTTSSRELLKQENIVLNEELLDWFSSQFASEETTLNPSYLQSLENAVAGNMPPSWILTCGFDPLRDDGGIVRDQLTKLGSEVSFKEYEDLYHGFIGASALFKEVDEMAADLSVFIKKSTETRKQPHEAAAE
ncbi:alpha/beta hydrolase fold domain-containing protein [Sneathiella sp. P13V-1]|uniref:alpha/beta hydrolase n=1 Tax=Sneathiella sp. P13V-1 TaxID=2697366 RepID=UPI00187B40CA|nr:alpha/beta hydrolase [Sneathiella sp. P13V-1]MBE7637459.1 alpha/beta hydrolase fold domain-containing protein [Sneathiella sp. P13V-1]